jgi:peroxiredoxin Q/BCP
MEIGDKAAEFRSVDQNGAKIALKDFKGKWVVLYFYPRADTPGCTVEACGFRDSFKKIEKRHAVVLGVSPDGPKAQKKFEQKYDLPFRLVADENKAICNAYGVFQEKNMYGKKVMGVVRTTFVIGPDGRIKHIFSKVKPEGHAEEVLAHLEGQASGSASP